MISWQHFEEVDIRSGTIIEVQSFPKAHKPAYKLTIDIDEYGIEKSSAQITKNYLFQDLISKQVVAVINFPPKQIADYTSECLILSVYDGDNGVVLLQPEIKVNNGCKAG